MSMNEETFLHSMEQFQYVSDEDKLYPHPMKYAIKRLLEIVNARTNERDELIIERNDLLHANDTMVRNVGKAMGRYDEAKRWVAILTDELDKAMASRDWSLHRCDLLQDAQRSFREPERTIVCDILANGSLLPDPDGSRYKGRANQPDLR